MLEICSVPISFREKLAEALECMDGKCEHLEELIVEVKVRFSVENRRPGKPGRMLRGVFCRGCRTRGKG